MFGAVITAARRPGGLHKTIFRINMKYYIGLLGIGSAKEITNKEVLEIKKYNSIVQLMKAIEERFDILLENYYDFENTIAQVTLKDIIFTNHIIPDIPIMQRTIIRSINNLLSSCRLFLDQCDRLTKRKKVTLNELITNKRHELFDSNSSYRLMEYLRNTMQHKFLPIGIGFSRNFEKNQKANKVTCSVDITVDKKMLLIDDPKEIRHIKEDIERIQSETISIKQDIRNYVNCINAIFAETRKNLLPEYEEAKQFMIDLYEKYNVIRRPKEQEIQIILDIFSVDENDFNNLITRISDSVIRDCNYLQTKNSVISSYSTFIMES
jgi:hypothetical protein